MSASMLGIVHAVSWLHGMTELITFGACHDLVFYRRRSCQDWVHVHHVQT